MDRALSLAAKYDHNLQPFYISQCGINNPQKIKYFAELIYQNKVEFTNQQIDYLKTFSKAAQFLIIPDYFDFIEFEIDWLILLKNQPALIDKFSKNQTFMQIVKKELKANFNDEFAVIYSELALKEVEEDAVF